MAMTIYDNWYGGLGGYAHAKAVEQEFPSATVLRLVRKPVVPKGWADWYRAAADGLWQ